MDEARSALRIVVAPPGAPPFLADAVVAEEDTYLVLSPDYEAHETREPPEHLLKMAAASQPAAPGSVVVRASLPVRLLAIVHDLNEEPSWREEWVTTALATVLREAESKEFRSIALPMLGTLYGSLDERRFVELFRAALDDAAPVFPESIWLMVRPGTPRNAFEPLDGYDVDLRSLEDYH
jgi:hypothetical protein